MKKYKFKINGQTFETKIKEYKGTSAIVTVNGVDIPIEIEPQKNNVIPKLVRNINKPTVSIQTPKLPKAGAGDVLAPIPGTVVKILVKEGDFVNEGDAIIILEAMKMESEINASLSGRITEIKVKEGESVQEEQILVHIEAEK